MFLFIDSKRISKFDPHYSSNAIREQTRVQVYRMRLQLRPAHKISGMTKMITTIIINHHERVDFPDKCLYVTSRRNPRHGIPDSNH